MLISQLSSQQVGWTMSDCGIGQPVCRSTSRNSKSIKVTIVHQIIEESQQYQYGLDLIYLEINKSSKDRIIIQLNRSNMLLPDQQRLQITIRITFYQQRQSQIYRIIFFLFKLYQQQFLGMNSVFIYFFQFLLQLIFAFLNKLQFLLSVVAFYYYYLFQSNLMVKFDNEDIRHIANEEQAKQRRYRSLGFLTVQHPIRKGRSTGTALLIAPRVIITTTHNVYDKQQKCMYTNFRFYFSVSGQAKEYRTIKDIKFLEEYKTSPMKDTPLLDYCVLILSEEVRFPQYVALCLDLDQGQSLSLFGYPSYCISPRKQSVVGMLSGKFYQSHKYDATSEPKIIKHRMSTEAGYSGAPIIIQKSDTIGCVGIHIGSYRAGDSNYGRLITEDVVVNVLSWVGEDDRSSIRILNLRTGRFWSLKQKMEAVQRQKITKIYKFVDTFDTDQQEKEKNASYYLKERLGGYIDFRIKSKYFEYITVNDVRLYYQLYSDTKTYTIEDLAEQYFYLTDRYLNLENKELQIEMKMPISNFIQNDGYRKKFEKMLNLMNSGDNILLYQYKKQDDIMQRNTNTSLGELGFQNYFFPKVQSYHIDVEFRGNKYSKDLESAKWHYATFKKMITDVRQEFNIISNTFLVKGNLKIYGQEDYQKTFEQLNIDDSSLQIIFYQEQCFFSSKTQIKLSYQTCESILHKEDLNKYSKNIKKLQQISFSITQQIENMKVLTYKEEQEKSYVSEEKVIKSIENSQISEYYVLTYKSQLSQIYCLECTKSVLLKLQTREWLPVKDIRQGDKILGVEAEDPKTLTIYNIITIQKKIQADPQTFYGFSVQNTHSFIGNNLILHNQDSFSIQVIEIGKQEKHHIQVYRQTKIKQVLKDVDVYAGGTLLKPELSFGDYQLYNSRKVYICPTGYKKDAQDEETRLSVCEWKKQYEKGNSDSYQSIPSQEKEKWEKHHLGIFNQQIIPIHNLKTNIDQQVISSQIIVAEKTHLERIHYLQQIHRYQKYEKDALKDYVKIRNQPYFKYVQQKNKKMDEKEIFPIYLYTTPTKVNRQLNEKLRNHSLYENTQENKKTYALINSIFKSVRNLPKLKEQTTVYRGVALQNRNIYKKQVGNIIVFEGFTSTSRLIQVAEIYSSENGVLFEIQTYSGKYIKQFSSVPDDQQVLLLPYTCFLIESYDDSKRIPIIKLKQIPQPATSSNNLIFWVDDNPDNNTELKRMLGKDIEVIEVLSTRLMETILRDFFWIYRFLNKKVMVISDMVRDEDGKLNMQAGADIFTSIYNELGFSNKAVIYTSDPYSVKRVLRKRNIYSKNWSLLSSPLDIIDEINAEFQNQ